MGASNAALTAGVVRTERRRSRVMFNWVRTRNDRSAPRATRRCFCLVLRAAGVLYASGQCSCRTRHSFGAKLVVRCPQRDEVFPSYQSADPRPWSALAPFGGAWRMGASDLPRERSSRFCRFDPDKFEQRDGLVALWIKARPLCARRGRRHALCLRRSPRCLSTARVMRRTRPCPRRRRVLYPLSREPTPQR